MYVNVHSVHVSYTHVMIRRMVIVVWMIALCARVLNHLYRAVKADRAMLIECKYTHTHIRSLARTAIELSFSFIAMK